MARRFGRRRYNGQWLPTTSTSGSRVADLTVYNDFTLGIDSIWVAALLPGSPPNPTNIPSMDAVGGALSLATQNAVLIKRVVGSIFVGFTADDNSDVTDAIVAAGIFWDRTDFAGADQNYHAWHPLAPNAYQKRWMWYRTWMLSNPANDATTGDSLGFPFTNAEYGSIREGTHLDCKGKARIGYEEMLYLAIGVQKYAGFEGSNNGTINAFWNLRTFGAPSLRTTR